MKKRQRHSTLSALLTAEPNPSVKAEIEDILTHLGGQPREPDADGGLLMKIFAQTIYLARRIPEEGHPEAVRLRKSVIRKRPVIRQKTFCAALVGR